MANDGWHAVFVPALVVWLVLSFVSMERDVEIVHAVRDVAIHAVDAWESVNRKQLEEAYLHHKNEIVREVKGDVRHMLEDFKYEEHKDHFHHGELSAAAHNETGKQPAAKSNKTKESVGPKDTEGKSKANVARKSRKEDPSKK